MSFGLDASSIKVEMEKSYLEYAISVIVSRAIPDVRDGLKPVHRRILYAMLETSCYYNRPYKKSARIVGEVMGKYHPHGDNAIYDALVRMAQDFSMRVPLIDGQGNFGSIDKDSAAAMRYTESRLSHPSHFLLEDIDKDTVDFRPNYDGSESEPIVLPARFPNILVNGSEGIAVGMATSIPTHNLGEVIDACVYLIDNPNASFDEIFGIIGAPDFPTGGIILANSDLKKALQTGRGSVKLRGKTKIEEMERGKSRIIITEVPYQVVKAYLVEAIANLSRDKKIDGIVDIRDESSKDGIRVVIEIRKDCEPEVILNHLYKFTELQTSVSYNVLALNKNRPEVMGVMQILKIFIEFREEVVVKRTNFLLNKAKNKAHILIGLTVAVDFVDEVVAIIRGSADQADAKFKLISKKWNAAKVVDLVDLIGDTRNKIENQEFSFTEEQVKAILEMRLSKLTGLERESIVLELKELSTEINGYLKILYDRATLIDLIKSELIEVKNNFSTPRKTEVSFDADDVDVESLIQKEDIIVSYTTNGYIKRDTLVSYNTQRRGGKGKLGIKLNDDDVISDIFVATTHSYILFFTNKGRVYEMKGYKIPQGNSQSKGRAVANLFNLQNGEKIQNFLVLPENKEDYSGTSLIFVTKKGTVKKSEISDFERINSNGKIAIGLDDDDELISVKRASEVDHILISSFSGQSVRFEVSSLRFVKMRSSHGVRGIYLDKKDRVISLDIIYGVREDVSVRDEYLKIPSSVRIEIAGLTQKHPDFDKIAAERSITIQYEVVKKLANNEEFILTVTENGYGKMSSAYEYRVTSRGGKGVRNIITSNRNGGVVASFVATKQNDIIVASSSGKVIRCSVSSISIVGRNSQGIKIISAEGSEKVVSVTKVVGSSDDSEKLEIELETSELIS